MSTVKQELGKLGESLACKYLEKKGYKIIERNYHTKNGEIDIIALDGEILVFVEVKTRTSQLFGSPEEAIDCQKYDKLAQTAEFYFIERSIPEQIYRIDSIGIEIDEKDKKVKVRHEKDLVR
jgi:putative endonuclease